ncbi:hypothetical protein QQS21_007712 [Conoideocrella luteorostrata]|uniref:Uncharacterized protein n=1 Tax=Conoideocrella luteorostrata TaxID=1105319 RepID=A0AAJ0FS56_9HYPO|nr:hypothetical protein QQS21_007712 [Conoideocrella luteorostrata]
MQLAERSCVATPLFSCEHTDFQVRHSGTASLRSRRLCIAGQITASSKVKVEDEAAQTTTEPWKIMSSSAGENVEANEEGATVTASRDRRVLGQVYNQGARQR